nr:hypothetical protein [Cressdnaviricota sp.]
MAGLVHQQRGLPSYVLLVRGLLRHERFVYCVAQVLVAPWIAGQTFLWGWRFGANFIYLTPAPVRPLNARVYGAVFAPLVSG